MEVRILFVCTGNTCRSPMAEGLARNILGEGYVVESAGLAAWEGDSASRHAIQILKEKGIDLAEHRARLVNEEMLAQADWIIPMTKAQEMQLQAAFPEYKSKIKRLRAWEDPANGRDIQDPWGGSLEIYRQCAAEIEELLKKVKKSLE